MSLGDSVDEREVVRKAGCPPRRADEQTLKYLRTKLDETRKDCQWLIGLGAASVFGVLIKEDIVPADTWVHRLTLVVIGCQMFIALIGAMSLWQGSIDESRHLSRLELILKIRYWLRNGALVLLVAAFSLLASQLW